MTEFAFDALTRRASLLTLGAGLAAAAPLLADGKKNKRKKTKKKARKKCQSQVAQCETAVIEECEGDPDCIAGQSPCCAFLGECDFPGFAACLFSTVA